MTAICVAVLTYKRPETLARLLSSLAPQVADAPDVDATVLVVDNDPAASAEDTVRSWRATWPGDAVDLRYVHESTPGIAAARNRALDETHESDVLVYIDDDQVPAEAWLATLLQAWRDGLGDLIAGPVRPVYSGDVRDWIVDGPFHDGPHLPTGRRMTHAEGGNLLLDRRVVERLGCRFPDYGTRGAEDSHFTKALVDRGARLTWCAEAVVLEPVPTARTTPSWVVRRSFGNGLSWGALLAESTHNAPTDHDARRRAGITAQGGLRVMAGLAALAVGIGRRRPAQIGLGVHRAARGLGMMGGAWGLVFDEYARPGTQRWRWERAAR